MESQKETSLECLALQLFQDNGQTEAYRNWCKLFDPSKPWREPDLQRRRFPCPLYYASSEGLEPLVLALLKAGADHNTAGETHGTCLQAAACDGHVGIVRILLETGADPNGGGGLYENPIIAASASGHVRVVGLLLKYGADPNDTGFGVDGIALTVAARRNHIEVVRLLINGGADPNRYHPKPKDVNPLEAASSRGCEDCGRDMLKIFVDFVPDGVLNYTAALGYEDLVTELLDRGAKPENRGHWRLIDKGAVGESYALASAARNGNADLVKLLLTHGANVNVNSSYGPALQIVVYEGHKEIFQILIEHDASLEDGSGSYGGPVQAAVLGDHVDGLKLILAAGADINMLAGSSTITGGGVLLSGSPIQAAVVCSNIPMVDFLLEHGANPNLCGNRRTWKVTGTPLSIAAEDGNLDLINRLLDAGADVNQLDEGSDSGPALFWVVKGGFFEVVKRLLDAGTDSNALYRTSVGGHATILAEACMRQNILVVEGLLEAGADIHKYSDFRENNEPMIHTAARCSDVDVIRVLMKHGADVNEQSEGGATALHKAAWDGRNGIVKALLLEFQADPSLSLVNGSPPIHTAASRNNPECIEVLVQAGSDLNAPQ